MPPGKQSKKREVFNLNLRWIKLPCDIYDNMEIRCIEKLERGYAYETCWTKLMCLAGKINDHGKIHFSNRKKMISIDEIATAINMPQDIVEEAICIFDSYGMITYNSESGLVIECYDRMQNNSAEDDDFFNENGAPDKEECRDGAKPSEANARDSSAANKRLKDMTAAERTEYYRISKRKYRSKEKNRESIAEKEPFESKDVSNDDVAITDNDFAKKRVISDNVLKNSDNVLNDVLNNSDNVLNPPKNIFIEENRREEIRIDEIREEKTRIENNSLSFNESERDKVLKNSSKQGINDDSLTLPFADDNNGSREEAEISEAGADIVNSSGEDSPDIAGGEEAEIKADTTSHPLADGDNKADTNSGNNAKFAENKYSHPLAAPKSGGKKKQYGFVNNVLLSEWEYSELKRTLGERADTLIDELSSYIAGSGDKYKSHYYTLLRWAKNSRNNEQNSAPVYDYRLKGGFLGGNAQFGDGTMGGVGQSGFADGTMGGVGQNGYGGKGGNSGFGGNGGFSTENNHGGKGAFGGYSSQQNKNSTQKKSNEQHRYGDFDPEEAFRRALERTEMEFAELNAELKTNKGE